ncbi:MAG: phenylalanine--tRNA ligase subunit beta [Pirellulales bacterium]
MIVSYEWLADYVELPASVDELTERLTLSGLNLESVTPVGGDVAIDLEVTSNRPDCLGLIGVAREVAVLFGSSLKKPDPQPKAGKTPVGKLARVTIDCPELCPRYTARVIRGVKVGPSPAWLADRLRTLGIAVINNVVDATNYVLMECGQPLHAFDFAKLAGGKIIVRAARPGEEFTAIDHKTYKLEAGTCVIADAQRAVALGGVMGGADTEVSAATTDLLIESAEFDPMSIRATARRHHLHSPSSYRFERGVGPEGIDWASRRCCELILELAGGELAEGVIDVGPPRPPRQPVMLRFAQIQRLLGIDVPAEKVRRIFKALGLAEQSSTAERIEAIPPSWRADLTREADLIEEVARIHGYEKIPENVGVPMVPSKRSRDDLVIAKVRKVLTAAGFNEALTISAVEPELVDAFRPWTSAAPLTTGTPVLRRANTLRQSLVPSLLTVRRLNETLSNPTIELFEIAGAYLPRDGELPAEKRLLSLTSGGGFLEVKGVVESILQAVAPRATWKVVETTHGLLDAARSCAIELNGTTLGYLGEVSREGLSRFDLRGSTTVAEIDLGPLISAAELISRVAPLSNFPPVSRDLNIVFDERVRWADVEQIVRASGGEVLEQIAFQEVWRDPERLGKGKKSLLFSIVLRSATGTLTSEEADAVRDRIVAELEKKLGGKLRA